jgi:antitoxin component YwqK of YwqJK toxin-antitoxin module
MRLTLLFIALICSTFVSAQTLLSQERWPDGALKATRYSEGDRIHFITYHESGKVKEKGTFCHGKRDGEWKQYSESGTLVARAAFNKGVRQGVWEFRNDADRPLGLLVYSNGALVRGETYDEGGGLLAQRDY